MALSCSMVTDTADRPQYGRAIDDGSRSSASSQRFGSLHLLSRHSGIGHDVQHVPCEYSTWVGAQMPSVQGFGGLNVRWVAPAGTVPIPTS